MHRSSARASLPASAIRRCGALGKCGGPVASDVLQPIGASRRPPTPYMTIDPWQCGTRVPTLARMLEFLILLGVAVGFLGVVSAALLAVAEARNEEAEHRIPR